MLGAIHAGKTTPTTSLQRVGADAPEGEAGRLRLISPPTDFLGLNIWRQPSVARAGKNGARLRGAPRADQLPAPTAPGCAWCRSPYWGPIPASAEVTVTKAIHITENGCT